MHCPRGSHLAPEISVVRLVSTGLPTNAGYEAPLITVKLCDVMYIVFVASSYIGVLLGYEWFACHREIGPKHVHVTVPSTVVAFVVVLRSGVPPPEVPIRARSTKSIRY